MSKFEKYKTSRVLQIKKENAEKKLLDSTQESLAKRVAEIVRENLKLSRISEKNDTTGFFSEYVSKHLVYKKRAYQYASVYKDDKGAWSMELGPGWSSSNYKEAPFFVIKLETNIKLIRKTCTGMDWSRSEESSQDNIDFLKNLITFLEDMFSDDEKEDDDA